MMSLTFFVGLFLGFFLCAGLINLIQYASMRNRKRANEIIEQATQIEKDFKELDKKVNESIAKIENLK